MKFSVERDVFSEAVAWTARSVSQRPSSPVLAGILLTAENGIVTLESYDYEVSAHIEFPADIATEGTILVSGKLLAEISRSLPSSKVTLEQDGSKVTITAGRSRFNVATMPVADYPARPATPEVAGTVDGEAFAHAIQQVIVAASKDDTLPILTGVKLEFEGDAISFLATDRYRLSLRELNWKPAKADLSTSALVKGRILNEVARTLGSSGELTISLGDKADIIGFESGNRRTTSVLVDGDYPKIRSLFPSDTPVHASVSTQELAEAVRRVAIVAERNTPIRMSFTDGQLTLEAGTGEDAQAEESISAALDGDDITVAFNPTYLSEGLGAFDTDFVRFSFTTAAKPAMLTGQREADGSDDDAYRYLVMPIRLPNS